MTDEQHIAKLFPDARNMLNKSTEEKIRFVREDRWLPYAEAERLLERMDALYNMPEKIRAPSMLVVGDSHCGKSSLVRRFCDMHPKTNGMYEAACPVFYLHSCPPEPDEHRLYEVILQDLKIPFRYSDRPSKKLDEVRYQFEQIGVKMIILDEMSNALSGSTNKQRVFMNAIKNLHNAVQRPVVLVGTHEAEFVTISDPQFQSRFKIESLGRWNYGIEFQRFLAKLELTLPFEQPSLLATSKLSRQIFDRAKSGCIGDFVDLVAEAAVSAVSAGAKKITSEEILGCDFSPSSERQDSKREI
ncbi:TniB family NTP-binding protein [Malonomonas rubra]|uniref:TniB family NTP-binding protein n=1 Tax=Malonomonas rubra TaxID=57040 RepID=UPI001FC945BA|nr:TniB family NTP-binding protein [Malonomonas rubra]